MTDAVDVRPAGFDPACPSSEFPFQVGGKWTGLVVVCLHDGPRRFTELRHLLGDVTPKVLTQTLRNMERDGLVTRRSLPVNPPHVEYELTALGMSLMVLIDAARSWSRDHLDDLLLARHDHDLADDTGS